MQTVKDKGKVKMYLSLEAEDKVKFRTLKDKLIERDTYTYSNSELVVILLDKYIEDMEL